MTALADRVRRHVEVVDSPHPVGGWQQARNWPPNWGASTLWCALQAHQGHMAEDHARAEATGAVTRAPRRRLALVTTDNEDKAIAAAAMTGESTIPKNG